MNSPLEVEYYIELAENSLALGASDAALQLLAQVDENHRDNRWTATQVEALRLSGDDEASFNLVTAVLPTVISERDWPTALRMLRELGRVCDDRCTNREALDHLHILEVNLRQMTDHDLEFKLYLIAMLASRIVWEGDTATANQIVLYLQAHVDKISSHMSRANLLWVLSELEETCGNIEVSIALMEKASAVYQEQNAVGSATRAIWRVGALAGEYIDLGIDILSRIRDKVEAELSRQLGDANTITQLWLSLHLARLECLLGQPREALNQVEAIGQVYTLSDEALGQFQIVSAMCQARLGNSSGARWHLDNALVIFTQMLELKEDFLIRSYMRQVAHQYADLGDLEISTEILDSVAEPVRDLSHYLPKFD